jgi:hypothetical protein
MTLATRLAGMGMSQADLRRLLIDLGDRRQPSAIAKAIEREIAGHTAGHWLGPVLSLLERMPAQDREAA